MYVVNNFKSLLDFWSERTAIVLEFTGELCIKLVDFTASMLQRNF